jgi:shikimate dehydrogenase
VRLAVLGDPVAHSLSPVLHTAALRAAGLPGSYVALQVDEPGMAHQAHRLRSGELDGVNITMPHKTTAAHLSDRVAEQARRTGAVNTWVRVADDIIGHNTDVAGVQHAWVWAGLPDDTPVLVLGAGGAAAAAVVALGGRRLFLAARRADSARRLLALTGVPAEQAPWGHPMPGAVVVNATPLGMKGERLPEGMVDQAAGLFDMAYGHRPTAASARAAELGIPAADGPMMLLGQAIESFRLWTGRVAPVDAMQKALDAELAQRVASPR